jgi:hypothetical protein
MTFSCVAVIIACRYSVSFLKTSMNSHMPRLPTFSAPFRSRHARVALAVHVELRDVLAADQHRGVLVVRVDRRDDADADPVPLREEARW